jgi:hypothetical protein
LEIDAGLLLRARNPANDPFAGVRNALIELLCQFRAGRNAILLTTLRSGTSPTVGFGLVNMDEIEYLESVAGLELQDRQSSDSEE